MKGFLFISFVRSRRDRACSVSRLRDRVLALGDTASCVSTKSTSQDRILAFLDLVETELALSLACEDVSRRVETQQAVSLQFFHFFLCVVQLPPFFVLISRHKTYRIILYIFAYKIILKFVSYYPVIKPPLPCTLFGL
jgi:hypothetical protein